VKYQRQALHWLLSREQLPAVAGLAMHPLWIALPDRADAPRPVYANLHTGRLSFLYAPRGPGRGGGGG
jgi:hypothetical protein